MKALDIIDALTRMGCTEGTGLVETPDNPHEFPDWLMTWFGGDCDEIKYDETLKPSTKYVYSYETHLWSLKGTHKEDCRVEVKWEVAEDNNNFHIREESIYLYEVE